MPVSHVVRRLERENGSALLGDREGGDERLIAFVPEATLTEVLAAIAVLYNLKWSSRDPKEGKISYLLFEAASRGPREEDWFRDSLMRACKSWTVRPRKPRRDPAKGDTPFLVMRSAAIETARANWARIAAEGHLAIPSEAVARPIKSPILRGRPNRSRRPRPRQVDRYRRLRQRLPDEGKSLPSSSKRSPAETGR